MRIDNFSCTGGRQIGLIDVRDGLVVMHEGPRIAILSHFTGPLAGATAIHQKHHVISMKTNNKIQLTLLR